MSWLFLFPLRLEGYAAGDEPVLVRLPLEVLTEVRMGDPDERSSSLGHRLSLQVHDAVLGNDEHDVRTRRRHDVSLRQAEHDPAAALAALFVRRRQAYERLAAFRRVRTAHELQ